MNVHQVKVVTLCLHTRFDGNCFNLLSTDVNAVLKFKKDSLWYVKCNIIERSNAPCRQITRTFEIISILIHNSGILFITSCKITLHSPGGFCALGMFFVNDRNRPVGRIDPIFAEQCNNRFQYEIILHWKQVCP